MTARLRRFKTLNACADALADEIAAVLNDALKGRARASLALSGGNTPRHVLPHLAMASVDWARIDVTLTDERWVPPADTASNARLVDEAFLSRGAGAARFIGMWSKTETPQAGTQAADQRLAGAALPLDAVYLGMGVDGHVASLFPAASAARFVGAGYCVAGRAPTSPQARISLSLDTILAARTIFLQIAGAEKNAVLDRARRIHPHPRLPVSLIVHAGHPDLRVLTSP